MSLSDYSPEKAVVVFKGGQFEVRGITLDDLAILLRDHLDDLDAIVNILGTSMKNGVSQDTMVAVATQHALALVREAPGLVARTIAQQSDEPDAVENARKLPPSVQVDALEAIARLTFEEAGGPKKFFERLMKYLPSLTSRARTD